MTNFKFSGVFAAVTAAMLMSAGAPAMADSTDDILNALIAKGVLTEEEGNLLLKGREVEKDNKKKAVTAKFKDGIVFESGDGDFSMNITGRVHADYRAFDYNDGKNNSLTVPVPAAVAFNGSNAAAVTANTAAIAAANATNNARVGNSIANTTTVGADTFDIRRARLGVKGRYKEYYEFDILADIATGNNTSVTNTTWDNAFLNIAWWKEAQFRFGHFKMPMNLEELTSSNNIDFMERSYINQLSPTKELGAMIHGTPFTGITYALAYSNGAGAKQAETDIREDGKDVIGRVTANFAEIMGNKDMVMHTAVSYSTGDQAQGTVGSSVRTEARGATFFRAPVLANTPFQSIDRTRLGFEGALAYNQFKLQGEWLRQNNDFKTNKSHYDLDTDAYYLQALWAITGEKYADIYKNGVFGGIKPLKDFNPKTFSGGAWELGLRFSKLDASDYNTAGIEQGTVKGGAGSADAAITTKAAGFAEAKAYTAGIKFYPNSNTRFMLNYVKTDYSNVIGGTTGGIIINNKRVDDEKAVIMRAQWMF